MDNKTNNLKKTNNKKHFHKKLLFLSIIILLTIFFIIYCLNNNKKTFDSESIDSSYYDNVSSSFNETFNTKYYKDFSYLMF